MGMYKHIEKRFQEEYKERSDVLKRRITEWRDGPAVARVERPTNLARARRLGYKAKQGVIIARVKVERGMRKRLKPRGGRKPSKSGRFYAYRKSSQAVAEERASRRFSNCEVLNSYFIGEDGKYRFFETILLDRSSPAVMSDSQYAGVISMKGRAYRGLTNAGLKHRGMARRSFGTIKNRPSVRSTRDIVRV
jgi:large subunit ribosomal protein L15e